MTEFCQTLFTMTAAATVAALAVMLLRLLLRKAPRAILCALWLVVLFRMVCPVTFEAPVSLVPDTITSGQAAHRAMPYPVMAVPVDSPDETPPQQAQEPPVELMAPTTDQYDPLFVLWAAGAGVMALWAVISYARLRRRVADAVLIQDNIYETDRVDTPFVCGFIKPRIYLPAGLDPALVPHVVRHEQAHIQRLDHLMKPLFWLGLCLHWFNPVLWLAYIFFCRDLETACDQRVIRDLDRQGTADYAATLLCLGRDRSLPQAVPLAFGEENAKGRVKGVLHYKKPAFWVVVLAVVLCVGAGFLLLADSQQGESLEGVPITQASFSYSRHSFSQEDGSLYVDLRSDSLPENLCSRLVHLLEKHSHEEYSLPIILQAHEMQMEDPPENTPIANQIWDLDLSSPEHFTHFYFHLKDNGDGYLERVTYTDADQTAKAQQQAAYIPGLADKRDFQKWQADLQTYLNDLEDSGFFSPSQEDGIPFEGVSITGGELSEHIWSWTMLDGSATSSSTTYALPGTLLPDLLSILESQEHEPYQEGRWEGTFPSQLILGKLDEIHFSSWDNVHDYALLLAADGRYLLTHSDAAENGTWEMAYYTDLSENPDFQAWMTRLEDYLTTIIPEQIYSQQVDSVEKATPVLNALQVSGVVGPYTVETSPNTITILVEEVHTMDEIEAQQTHYLLWLSARVIDLVGDAYKIVWDYPGSEELPYGYSWEYHDHQKAQSVEEFRERYNSPKDMSP